MKTMRMWNSSPGEKSGSGSEESRLKMLIGGRSDALVRKWGRRMPLVRVVLAARQAGWEATVVAKAWRTSMGHRKCRFE